VEEWLWTLAGNLTAPLFDGGERRAEVDRAGAVLEQRLAAYGQTLLEAMQEVEDALVREQQQADQVQDLITQRRLASETLQQLELSYQNGVASFLDVLSARTQLQELERETLFARLDRLRFRIALHRALAGGFQLERETP
jgi:outer membrane protein TolC